ncbi:hypothetical protein [Rhizobium leguminosarum]
MQSMEIEPAAQRERALKGDLDKGFEDTFAASDPISATHRRPHRQDRRRRRQSRAAAEGADGRCIDRGSGAIAFVLYVTILVYGIMHRI